MGEASDTRKRILKTVVHSRESLTNIRKQFSQRSGYFYVIRSRK